MYVAARPRYRLEPTPATTPSHLAELLVDFEPSITADIFPPSLPLFGVLCLCVFRSLSVGPRLSTDCR